MDTRRSIIERLTGVPATADDAMVGDLTWSNPNRPVWLQRARSILVLLVLGVTAVTSSRHAIGSAAGIGTVALAVVCIAARLPITFRVRDPRLWMLSLVIGGLAGVGLALFVPASGAIAFAVLAVINATQLWAMISYTIFSIVLALIYVLGQLWLGRSVLVVLVGPAVIAVAILMGLIRLQSARLADEAALVRDSQAHSAALDERARIAREIHDVLAHSLAALTVQLETADALLESGRAEQAHALVLRASHLAREGMAETRRAIGALRGETLPLPDLVRMLAGAYEADLGGTAMVEILGVPRDLRPDVGLALYRSAQEAITNVRKHAPGAALTVALDFRPDAVGLDVSNGTAPNGERPLALAGGGYGLTGLRERAELAGGTVDAGPASDVDSTGGGWRVSVRIPA